MQALLGEKIRLRALEPEDLDFLYSIENDISFWEISSTQTPFSKHLLTQYLANAHLDIYEAKQLRLVIVENESDKHVGLIDLFNFNPQHKRAGIGILIVPQSQQKGYAYEALDLLIEYSFKQLDLHQLYANITPENTSSLKLFKKHNFKEVGVKKEWVNTNGKFKDEILFQLINK